MDISLLKLVVDTGLFILIWIVQIVIYPSFLYYTKVNLVRWHVKYITNFSYVVVPLMLSQLLAAIFNIFSRGTVTNFIYFILVISTWLLTFIIFVPIHKRITLGTCNQELLKNLIKKNWSRTIIWTLLFVLNILLIFLK